MLFRLVPLMVTIVFAVGALAPSLVDGAGKETKPPATPATGKTAPLDINSASVDELKALPAVGDTYAKKIADGRPYKQKDELVQRKIVPQATYDKIKDQIVARQK
jgi:competence protein ComEA